MKVITLKQPWASLVAYGNKFRTGYVWKLGNVKIINIDKKINGQLGL